MIIIVCALEIEAREIIKYYNLKKDNDIKKFQVYKNSDITLIIGGVGVFNSTVATTYILTLCSPDYLINIGVCGSSKYHLGDIILANKIIYKNHSFYPEVIFKHNFREDTICARDEIATNNKNGNNVDMESFGVCESGKHFLNSSQIVVIKIVSDNLENAKSITKNDILELMQKSIIEINEFIKILQNNSQKSEIVYSECENTLIKDFVQKFNFTTTMEHEFKNLLKYYKICGGDLIKFLDIYQNKEIKNKREGKKILYEIRKRIVN